MRGTTPELALAAKQESCIPPSPRLFKERLIYEQSAARTVREQQEKRSCDWSRQPLKIEQ
jgi:hypothetical protein